jgi:hypothetical protein
MTEPILPPPKVLGSQGHVRCLHCKGTAFTVIVDISRRHAMAGEVLILDGTEPLVGLECVACGEPTPPPHPVKDNQRRGYE